MSNSQLIIEERSRDIGGFLVGRLIPFRKKRMVGPFTFIDHMGPSEIGPHKFLDVDQHPHIGLSTLTYLFQGEVVHRDSTGTEQNITPGSVNWMVAGKGVTHTERTPAHLRNGSMHTLHGYQIWVALPKELEDIDPYFHHFPAADLPVWEEENAMYKLVAGKAYGKESPVPVHSDLFMIDLQTSGEHAFDAAGQLYGEIGIAVVRGSVTACGETISAGNMLVSKAEGECEIGVAEDSHILIFGGEPFPEERYIRWNFVSSNKDKLEQEKQRWINREFPKVPGDDSYVPWP